MRGGFNFYLLAFKAGVIACASLCPDTTVLGDLIFMLPVKFKLLASKVAG